MGVQLVPSGARGISNAFNPLLQALVQRAEQGKQSSDLELLQKFLTDQQSFQTAQDANQADPGFQNELLKAIQAGRPGSTQQGAEGFSVPGRGDVPIGIPQPPQMPQFQSERFKNASQSNLLAQLDPSRQAQLENLQSDTGLNQARSKALLNPLPPTQSFDTYETPEGELINVPKGANLSFLPRGTKKVGTQGDVNVNTNFQVPGENTAVEKGTKSKLEDDIKTSEEVLASFKELDDSFNPLFLKNVQGQLADVGVGIYNYVTGKEATGDIGTFVTDRADFKAKSQRIFLKFRKFITGVAGGIQEFNEIAKAMPSAEKDTINVYNGKYAAAKAANELIQDIALDMRSNGLPMTKPNFAREWRKRFATPESGKKAIQERISSREQNNQGGNAPASQQSNAPDGTIITNQSGQSLVKRNGKWQPM